MAQVHFLPSYAAVLEQVVVAAERDGAIDVSCRDDVDPAVVAGQVRAYATSTGRVVRCTARSDRVEVRAAAQRPGRRAG
jgi:hypothetical protein